MHTRKNETKNIFIVFIISPQLRLKKLIWVIKFGRPLKGVLICVTFDKLRVHFLSPYSKKSWFKTNSKQEQNQLNLFEWYEKRCHGIVRDIN